MSNSREETDSSLIASALDGDVESYGRLVARYEKVAHRTAYMLGAGDDTEDIVQDAFVKAYVALGRFRIHEQFRPWLLTIVANETRNRWRWFSRHRTVPLSLVSEPDAHATGPTPPQIVEDRETSRTLCDALVKLPRSQQDAIVCRYLLDLSERDTAQILGVPAGTVKSRLARGLRALRLALAPAAQRTSVEPERSDA
ncbi:MAG: RNA polymerase sigma factor [Nocardioidaceae bacterium]